MRFLRVPSFRGALRLDLQVQYPPNQLKTSGAEVMRWSTRFTRFGNGCYNGTHVERADKNLPDGVREALGAGIEAGLGMGGSAGAATAFNSDTNNRQSHSSEMKFLKSDEVVEKYIDYMAENGLILTEEGTCIRLNRFSASKDDENWAALNGKDALAEAFLVNGSEGPYYTDSMGIAMHSSRVPTRSGRIARST